MRTHQFTIRETAPAGLVAFRARILAAVPGKSLNGRIYTRELLKQTAPLYPSTGVNPRPFILDHDIEHSERVTGLITGSSYGVQETMDGRPVEGLWLEALGYMDERLFTKMAGSKTIPPFVRGVSIGGEGEGEFTGDGILIRKFQPAELSVTAFPGIPMAHVAELNRIREHYLNQSDKKLSTVQISEREVSLEEAEKQKLSERNNPRRTREGPLPPPDRGINDARPGLPAPTIRSTIVHQQPQPTTASNSGFALNPEDSTASSIQKQKLPTPSYAAAGYSPTATAGFKKNTPSGTGLRDQEAAPGTAADRGAQGSKDAKVNKIKTPKTGATTTKRRPDSKPVSGAGMDSDDEESMQDLGDQTNPLPMSQDQPASRTDLKRSMNQNPGMPGENPHDKNEDESHRILNAAVKAEDEEEEEEEEEVSDKPLDQQEEEEEEESKREHGPSPHIPGSPVGKKSKHSADNAYDSPADTSSEEEEESSRVRAREDDPTVGVTKKMKPGTYDGNGEEEEEEDADGVSVDPVRKVAGQGQNINANPTKEENQPEVLFSEAEAIQARAFSLPTNSGILATLARLATPQQAKEAMQKGNVVELVKTLTRPDNTMSREQIAKLIENWNRGKMPKEQKPVKIIIRKPGIGAARDLSIPDARKAPVDETVVKTKSITAVAPTMGATTVSTIPNSRLEQLIEEEKKRPYSNVSYLNPAKRAWNRAVQELMEFR